jgi:hypothetical protein
VEGLTGADVTGFLLRESRRLRPGSVRCHANQLRQFLRYLSMRGFADPGLAPAVPSVGRWREVGIPQFPARPAIGRRARSWWASPLLPALFALIAGIGGALGGAWVGGTKANEGAQLQFENQQTVRERDLQRAAFADFLTQADAVHFGTTPQGVDKAVAAEANVELVADTTAREAAHTLVRTVQRATPCVRKAKSHGAVDKCFDHAQNAFVDAVRTQLGTR